MWGVNDYPGRTSGCGQAGLCGGFAKRNCTDFCAWRMLNDLRVGCPAPGSGNALTWAQAARSHGIAVDNSPRPGDVACFQPGIQGAGSAGHVAMVLHVLGGGHWVAEQYNYGTPEPCCCYSNSHIFSTAGVEFIHYGGTPPPPPLPACGSGCPAGTTCVAGQCQCPAGTGWNGAACVPISGGAGGSAVVPLAILGTVGVIAVWEARRHRAELGDLLHAEHPSFGASPVAVTRAGFRG